MAQSVARILGKDEVTGSNPVSSSKAPKTLSFRDFFVVCESAADRILFCYYFTKGCGQLWYPKS